MYHGSRLPDFSFPGMISKMRISDAIDKLARAVRVEQPRTIGYCDPAVLIRDADLSFLMEPKNAESAQSGDDGEDGMNRPGSADSPSPSRPSTSPSV